MSLIVSNRERVRRGRSDGGHDRAPRMDRTHAGDAVGDAVGRL